MSGLSPRPGPAAPTPSHLDGPGSRVHAHVGAGVQGRAHVGGKEVLSSLHREKGDARDLEEPPGGSGRGTLGPGLGLSWERHTKMGQARLAALPGKVLHLLGHSGIRIPGLPEGKSPEKAPSGTPSNLKASSKT